jgi:two-component system, OmpR family, phosphate regulon sensor histidine kinase PhoR
MPTTLNTRRLEEVQRVQAALVDARAARDSMGVFLDAVVHDLRAPLTVVRGYCSLILEGTFGAVPRGLKQPLEIVETKVREAQRLVDQLLLAARLESGEIAVNACEVDLAELVRETVARAEPLAQLDNARVIAKAPPAGRIHASGDKAQLEQILDNLVANALAYAGTSPQVEVSAAGGASPRVTVTDWGVGIPADQQERIFDRFHRGNEAVPGNGLGLYVSRHLALANGGTLELDGSWEYGSRFVLRLQPTRDRERSADSLRRVAVDKPQ